MTIIVPTSMVAYLNLYSHGEVSLAASQPVILYTAILMVLIFSFEIFYLPSRYYLLKTVWHIILPLQAISFSDFFLANILTSMSKRRRCSFPIDDHHHTAEKTYSQETDLDRFCLSDAGLALLAKRCKGLEKLSFIWCSSITSLGLTTIAENCTFLKSVDLQSHRDAKGLYRKPWPLYNEFEEIFSKDRATGSSAASAADRDDQDTNEASNNEQMDNSRMGQLDTPMKDPSLDQEAGSGAEKRKNKKQKSNDIEHMQGQLVDLMQQMIQSNNDCVAQLVNALKSEERNDRALLRDELGLVPGLTIQEILYAMRKMSNDDVTMFYSLRDTDEKYAYVQMVLRTT